MTFWMHTKIHYPRFTLIPDDRAFRRVIPDSKVLFEDNFNKQSRNIDYIDNQDESFQIVIYIIRMKIMLDLQIILLLEKNLMNQDLLRLQ